MPRFGVDFADSIAGLKAAPLASSDVLVTMPLRWASRMPRLTPSVQARSSALTMRFFMRADFADLWCPKPFNNIHPAHDEKRPIRRSLHGVRADIPAAEALGPLASAHTW